MFLSKFIHFLEKLFGPDSEKIVIQVVDDLEGLVVKAQPIISALSAVVTEVDSANPTAAMDKVAAVLRTFVTAEDQVAAFVAQNSGLALGTLLHNAAMFALSYLSPSSLVLDIEAAITIAYKVFAVQNPTITGNAKISLAIGKAPAQPAPAPAS